MENISKKIWICKRIIKRIRTNKIKCKGIGKEIINKMKEYFKSVGFEYINIEFFAYKENTINFYNKKGYHAKMLDMIKKIG